MSRPFTLVPIKPPLRRSSPTLEAELSEPRRLECDPRRELIAQTGHDVSDWPLVILKELIDNALDAAEETDVPPEIDVNVSTETGEIIIAEASLRKPVQDILDYSYRVSSREAYVSPTRGAQGNALKTLVAMPFADSWQDRHHSDRSPRGRR